MFCTWSAWGPCGPLLKIVYTNPMDVPNQIIVGPCNVEVTTS